MSTLELIAIASAAAIGLGALVFWGWMIYDCATKTLPRSRERYVWLLIVVLGKLPGAVAYYLLKRQPAKLEASA